ncbi:MAG TPA: serine/threonine-protein kinase [Pyrinomonadaceae bacterium]|nr:serine/threonine-protein kinase [Pyrinomonadaceae bacterium]
MTPEQWQKVEEVFHGALDHAPQDRAAFLAEVCSEDGSLKDEATALVDAYEQAGEFIEQPAIAQDARVLLGEGDDNIGREVGPYKILERLGGGGMGEVYLAHDERLNRRVALKILPSYFASDGARLHRFQREAQAASALNHPNILTIHEVGDGDGIYYFATEFIDGSTIRELINRGDLSFDEILEIAEQIAGALASAHQAGIVHRDIKPENIMRRQDGLVKILDFGIAKLIEVPAQSGNDDGAAGQTETGLVMGTVDYMSPEQARALPVDQRTDIWSFGVVLYEMVTGRKPFTGATRMDKLAAILRAAPAPISEFTTIHERNHALLQPLLSKALCKDPAGRFQSAEDLLKDLREIRSRQSNEVATHKTAGEKDFSPSLAQRHFWLATMLLLAAIVTAGVIYQRTRWRADSAQAPASVALGKTYAQMNEAEQLLFIAEQEQRISTMMGDRPVKLDDSALRAIKGFVDHYRSRTGRSAELGEGSVEAMYARARPYAPLIAGAFAERKVPVIIGLYLPVIESAYRDCHESRLGGKGLFQFLPTTADHYGVPRSAMCDIDKMAPAAAHYVADHMAELGEDSQSMTLVLLSYNRGANWVRDALRELRASENYQRNFWTLHANRERLDSSFQNESAGYVPAFFAAAIIGENPEAFGLPGPALSVIARQ